MGADGQHEIPRLLVVPSLRAQVLELKPWMCWAHSPSPSKETATSWWPWTTSHRGPGCTRFRTRVPPPPQLIIVLSVRCSAISGRLRNYIMTTSKLQCSVSTQLSDYATSATSNSFSFVYQDSSYTGVHAPSPFLLSPSLPPFPTLWHSPNHAAGGVRFRVEVVCIYISVCVCDGWVLSVSVCVCDGWVLCVTVMFCL